MVLQKLSYGYCAISSSVYWDTQQTCEIKQLRCNTASYFGGPELHNPLALGAVHHVPS